MSRPKIISVLFTKRLNRYFVIIPNQTRNKKPETSNYLPFTFSWSYWLPITDYRLSLQSGRLCLSSSYI